MSNGGCRTGGEGRLVGGRYRLIERIGSGGMGTVWRAHDELVERDVAVKQPLLAGDPEDEGHQRAAHRLYREARAAAHVDHPCAVAIHDVVVEDGLPWIVMELIRGQSLHEVLRRGPLEPAEAARIGLAVLGALRAAHAVGIVHRDVKPANVLLGPHGRVVLTDFGIAHIQGEESLTVSGEFVGSLEFIAPERMSGPGAAGPASDLWSLGVLLYAAVEGSSPFRRTTPEATLAAILAAAPPEPRQAGPLAPLVVGLLRKEPPRRPGAEEAAAVLEAVAEGRPVPDAAYGEVPEDQEVSGPRKVTDDMGTLWLTGEQGSGASAGVGSASERESIPVPGPRTAPESRAPGRRRSSRRPLSTMLLGALLLGGLGVGAADLWARTADGSATEHTATYNSAPAVTSPGPATGTWTAHRERRLDAIVSVPAGTPRRTSTDRAVTYGDDDLRLRLTREENAPAPLRAWARQETAAWSGDGAATLYKPTNFHGDEAMLTDTTYTARRHRFRVLQLLIVTPAGEHYTLRVDMPGGTAEERRGTSLFTGARARLKVGSSTLGS
jgi:serine/threonine protein kinase